VLAERPDILNHNVETVERLYPRVRPQARYARSLEVLRRTAERAADLVCKSGIMVGLGETRDEVLGTMRDIAAQGTHVLTVGQYLRPSPVHLPIERYWTPEEFAELRDAGASMGFRHVESGPLVRSSYHAERHVARA
jgi:lipoic acid synthetase